MGRWIERQRNVKKGERRGEMKEYYIKKLESLPNWTWGRENSWDENFKKLKIFIMENGKYPSKSKAKKEDAKLAKWVENWKKYKKYNICNLTLEKIQKLESLPNWKW